MSKELQQITVTFSEGAIEYSVKYAHSPDEKGAGGAGQRTSQTTQMARQALALALEHLHFAASDEGFMRGARIEWGGYATDFVQTTDRILVERQD